MRRCQQVKTEHLHLNLLIVAKEVELYRTKNLEHHPEVINLTSSMFKLKKKNQKHLSFLSKTTAAEASCIQKQTKKTTLPLFTH